MEDWCVLSLPPSANSLFANFARGRIKSKTYKRWLSLSVPLLWLHFGRRYADCGPLHVRIVHYGKPVKAWDVDNRTKAILDAMVQSRVIDDDDWRRVRAVDASLQITSDKIMTYVSLSRWQPPDASLMTNQETN